jgi:WD40 repeat protein
MFSPDGQLLLARSTDQHLLTWQVADGRLLRRVPLRRDTGRMTISPDGRLIAIDTVDDGVLLLRAEDGSTVHQLADRGVNNLTFSPDGRYLALGLGPVRPTRPGDTGVRGAVHLWRLDGPNPYREHALAGADFVYAVAFSPDGQYLAAAGDRARESGFGLDLTWQAFLPAVRQIAIWRVVDGRPLQTIRTSHATIYGLTFGPDGRTLIAQGYGGDPNQGIITVWRVAPRWGWLDWLLPLSVVVAMVGWGVGWLGSWGVGE